MKAVVLKAYGSADNFVAADLPIPDLRKGDVRIKVKAISFNPVDYQIRKGLPEGIWGLIQSRLRRRAA